MGTNTVLEFWDQNYVRAQIRMGTNTLFSPNAELIKKLASKCRAEGAKFFEIPYDNKYGWAQLRMGTNSVGSKIEFLEKVRAQIPVFVPIHLCRTNEPIIHKPWGN